MAQTGFEELKEKTLITHVKTPGPFNNYAGDEERGRKSISGYFHSSLVNPPAWVCHV